MGEDFARVGDATDIVIAELGIDLRRRWKLTVELRNIPFEQQRDILFYILDRVPRFVKGAVDAGGNGSYLAEVAGQRYGSRIIPVQFSRTWYEQEMPPYIEAFSERTVILPAHEDVLRDHQALQFVDGIIRIPRDFRFKGSDGLDRHGDSAVAGALAWHASRSDLREYDYQSAGKPARGPETSEHDDPDDRPWWRSPLGARLRGGIY